MKILSCILSGTEYSEYPVTLTITENKNNNRSNYKVDCPNLEEHLNQGLFGNEDYRKNYNDNRLWHTVKEIGYTGNGVRITILALIDCAIKRADNDAFALMNNLKEEENKEIIIPKEVFLKLLLLNPESTVFLSPYSILTNEVIQAHTNNLGGLIIIDPYTGEKQQYSTDDLKDANSHITYHYRGHNDLYSASEIRNANSNANNHWVRGMSEDSKYLNKDSYLLIDNKVYPILYHLK